LHHLCGCQLQCSRHKCAQPCHPGVCKPCKVVKVGKCYYRKGEKILVCEEGDPNECADSNGQWVRQFTARIFVKGVLPHTPSTTLTDRKISYRPHSQGKHTCIEACHLHPLSNTTCLHNPSLIITCPCRKKQVNLLGPIWHSCTDTIPTCGRPYSCLYHSCNHSCIVSCCLHPCLPCHMPITMPCQCGRTTCKVLCLECIQPNAGREAEFLCNKLCKNLRNCRGHTCNCVCCPLAHIRVTKGKAKKKISAIVDEEVDSSGWYDCGLHWCSSVLHSTQTSC